MAKERESLDEYAHTPEFKGGQAPQATLTGQSFQPLGRHDLDKVQETHGIFDHSDGRLVVDPEEAKIEVSGGCIWGGFFFNQSHTSLTFPDFFVLILFFFSFYSTVKK